MGGGTPALVNPTMLSWARKERGFTLEEAAKKLGVPVEKLKACEAGNDRLTYAKFRNAAWIYRRPSAIFFLEKIPPSLPIPEFRRGLKKKDQPLSSALRLEIRKVRQKKKAAIELAEYTSKHDWSFIKSLSLQQDPDEAATRIRNMLSIPEDFPKGYDKYQSLNYWRHAIETTGTLVFFVSGIDTNEMRGFTIAESPFPVIAANRKDAPQARSFTLIHEFCHILLGDSSVCEIHRSYNYERDWSESFETYCNQVAGATLVPCNELLKLDIVKNHDGNEYWSEAELHRIAAKFQVSAEVILRRLLTLDLTSQHFYGVKHKEWSQRKYSEKKGAPRERIHEKIVRTDGLPFTNLVLDAMNANAIFPSRVAELLSMNLKHLPALQSFLSEKGE